MIARLRTSSENRPHVFKLLLVGLLALLACRIVLLRIWPQHAGPIVGVLLAIQHALLAFFFAVLAYTIAGRDPRRIIFTTASTVFALYEAAMFVGFVFVLVRRRETLAA